MRKFWIVIRAPKDYSESSISKDPGKVYECKKQAQAVAKSIAAKNSCKMLVLEVVDGYGPIEPRVKKLTFAKGANE